ncbi:MAG TPA: SRPBCC family protein [Opitutaceae bacterium]|jgi:ligand-binding SRPBCC domain-containing protein|nr:SRPBCC family protein [Opitutaceae bacterium]
MPCIDLTIEIAAPIERVFDLTRSIDAHQQSQSRHAEKAVAGRTSGLIGEGETVTWEARHLGARRRLTSRIAKMDRPRHFRDVMVEGSFARLEHDHFFESLPDGRTRMRDVFDYSAPFGWLGRIADHLFLEAYMRRLLAARNAVIKQLAEIHSES